jgi:hypothetical protein
MSTAALTPIAVVEGDGGPWVEWCDLRGIVPEEPFFEQTVGRAMSDADRRSSLRRTSVASLADDAAGSVCEPSGFVFHMSRCGSTLAGRLLRATGTTLVLSEPEPLDALLRLDSSADPAARVARLRGMVAALARSGAAEQRHVVVKFDAWTVFHMEIVRAAFPDVPWVFIFREPVDVTASQVRRPGLHMVPGSRSGITLDQALAMGRERYTASVLGRILDAALEQAHDPLARFVSYADLPDAVADVIAPWFGIEVSPAARAAMVEASRWDSRTPALPFVPGETATSDVAEAASALAPLHRELEALARRAA